MSRISDSESTVVYPRPEVGLQDFVSVRCVQVIYARQSRPPFSGSNSGPPAVVGLSINALNLNSIMENLPVSAPKSTVLDYVLGKPSSSAVLCCCCCESRCYTVP